MNNNNIKILGSHLEQEIKWIEKLNSILSEEKILLSMSQFDKLEELANQKQELSIKVENSAQKRMELVNGSITNKNQSFSLNDVLKHCTNEEAELIKTLNTKLLECLTVCRELNTVNGQVIANNLHTRQEIVNALSGKKADAISVYTSNGNIESSTGKNHHQEA